ncbi:alpha/beta hydrolase [Halorubellus sp. JP-L1]|uniref:alpha/beta hydrolase n=1 Tax=Halorubellus sp. JP-L1 TaxID=2715753 RepID=UPI00140D0A82|nr:alpha/beta hydrolase [Halorubellus sp. JP-L1]NHN41558.1 alpha/beta hydrolase [Halorubellus sp. JP-L1]
MPLEQLDFEVDGEAYEGRLVTPPEGDAESCVVVLPGAGHGPFGDIFDIATYELASAGVASFRFETWTNSDELDEKSLADLHAEMDDAVAFVRERGYDDLSMLVKSFGGRIAFTKLPGDVDRVLGWAPAVVFADDSRLDEQYDVPLGDLEDGLAITRGDVAAADAEVRLLYGDDDHFYPEPAESLADALPDAELRVLEDENHSFNEHRRTVVAETLDYLAD